MPYKNKIIGIYKITNKINNKVYIGQSIEVMQRLSTHKTELRNNKHNNSHLQYAWNKYGEENFIFEIIKECKIEELDKLEKYYINLYNSTNKDKGYNIELGGCLNREISIYTRNKISKSNKESNKNKGELNSYSKYTNEQIISVKKMLCEDIDIRIIEKTTSVSLKNIHRIRKLETWKTIGCEYNEKLLNIDYKRCTDIKGIIKFNKLMQPIKKYNSLEEAILDGDSEKSIRNSYLFCSICANYNYIYLKDDFMLNYNIQRKKEDIIKNNIFMICQIDNYGNEIQQFNSASECANILNLDASSIIKVCNGKINSTKGYKFKKKSIADIVN